MQVVAEGVETAAQREGLAGIGCDFAQGRFWGGPRAARRRDLDHTDRSGTPETQRPLTLR